MPVSAQCREDDALGHSDFLKPCRWVCAFVCACVCVRETERKDAAVLFNHIFGLCTLQEPTVCIQVGAIFIFFKDFVQPFLKNCKQKQVVKATDISLFSIYSSSLFKNIFLKKKKARTTCSCLKKKQNTELISVSCRQHASPTICMYFSPEKHHLQLLIRSLHKPGNVRTRVNNVTVWKQNIIPQPQLSFASFRLCVHSTGCLPIPWPRSTSS